MSLPHCIVAERRTYSNLADTHEHEYAQLILPLQGSLFVQTDLHQIELNEQWLFLVPPHCPHTFYACDRNEFLVLDISKTLLGSETARLPDGLTYPLDDRWRALRLLMLSELEDGTRSQPQLTDLFHYAYRRLLQQHVPISLQYIHAHYHQSLTTQQLAQLEGYSPTYYCEWFKRLTGTTPKLYIQTLRLQQSKTLLTHSDRSILEIAQQVGYEHHASLTRLFQQWEQMTPAAYRQQTRQQIQQSDKEKPPFR